MPPDDAVTVRLEVWDGPWPDDDPDANLKSEVAAYVRQDPLVTLRRLSRNVGIPVGALARYVLVKWVTGGSEGLLELGPSTVARMREAVDAAEAAGTDAARLEAYAVLRGMVGWLAAGLDDEEAAFPEGGA